MLKLRTNIESINPSFSISYADHIISLGSCFADNIGSLLEVHQYRICKNPFGTLYNPLSLRNSLALLLNNYHFEEEDLFNHQGLWHSFQHHSRFSNADLETCLVNINAALEAAREDLRKCSVLFLTLGTAWIYELVDSGMVVSNCHKLPAASFHRRRIAVEEIVEALLPILKYLKSLNPQLQIVLTVSPVRHLKDGFTENQLSKASLLLAADKLQEEDFIDYFPAYEIMQDDLRDYRFYERDLVHPNSMAIEYIWEIFQSSYLSSKEKTYRVKIKKLVQAAQHKPFNLLSESHQKFVAKQLDTITELKEQLPYLDFSHLEIHFKAQKQA